MMDTFYDEALKKAKALGLIPEKESSPCLHNNLFMRGDMFMGAAKCLDCGEMVDLRTQLNKSPYILTRVRTLEDGQRI